MRVDAASLFRDFVVNLTDLPDELLMHYRREIKKLGQIDEVRPEGFEHYLKAGIRVGKNGVYSPVTLGNS